MRVTNRIFLIDDDADLVRIISDLLKDEGYAVSSETHPARGIEKVRENPPDLLLLDIRMKDMSGLEVCKEIKADPRTNGVVVIMLSVKAEESDIILGLELGADDYIAKPIRRGELVARVKTALRRKAAPPEPERMKIGRLEIEPSTFTATVDGRLLALRPKEFELLAFFARREGQVVTRAVLSQEVWGRDHIPASQTIEFHVHQLRKKLGPDGEWIQGLKGIGYRFEIAEEE